MSSPRERQLAEGIENYMIAIQRSIQFSTLLLKWQENLLSLNETGVKEIANAIAAKVERDFIRAGKSGRKLRPVELIEILKKELSNI